MKNSSYVAFECSPVKRLKQLLKQNFQTDSVIIEQNALVSYDRLRKELYGHHLPEQCVDSVYNMITSGLPLTPVKIAAWNQWLAGVPLRYAENITALWLIHKPLGDHQADIEAAWHFLRTELLDEDKYYNPNLENAESFIKTEPPLHPAVHTLNDPQLDIFDLFKCVAGLKSGINKFLEHIAVLYKLSRVYVFETSPDENSNHISAEWKDEQTFSIRNLINDIPYNTSVLDHLSVVNEKGCYHTSSLTERTDADSQLAKYFDAKSLVHIAMYNHDKFIGFVGYSSVHKRDWTCAEIITFKNLTHFIANIVSRLETESQLNKIEKVFELILDNVIDNICITTINSGKILYVNKSLRTRLSSYSDDKIHIDNILEAAPELFLNNNAHPLTEIESLGSLSQREFWNDRTNQWYLVTEGKINWIDNSIVHLSSSIDITERKQSHLIIENMAYNDQLLKIPNRQKCQLDLNYILQQGNIQGAVIFIDLDDFKDINNAYGHGEGDALLLSVSEFLAKLPIGNNVYRFGGDEFIIILDGIVDKNVIDKLISTIIARFFYPWETKHYSHYCTASIGISSYPKDGSTFTDIFRSADIAMYSAKKNGKNCYAYFSPQSNAEICKRIELEKMLRYSVNNQFQGFEVYYQPFFDFKRGIYIGAEALLRWSPYPTDTIISPEQFIPLAENSGLIIPIGQWIIDKVCQDLLALNKSDFYLSINLSPRQIQEQDVIGSIIGIIDSYKIPRERICMEITENYAALNINDIIEKLEKLKATGIKVAMDDFGTGYSSLNNLKKLPVQLLKIDRSFISDIANEEFHILFVETICTLAHKLNIKVCAEGVETAQQVKLLDRLGVDYAQGNYYSFPRQFDEMMKIVYAADKLNLSLY
ncbi:MAG: bifunctional diguanylate cyclase/phosphodiesterase [Syntrophomonadaceae bacterium]|nr:bifunctional diguanylate cyclase/phosphodiesterase [Syntrophomonadaceae bacterium]